MLLIYRAFDGFYCSVAFVRDARALNYFVPSEVNRSYLLLTQRSVTTTTFRRGAHLIYSALWRCEGRCDPPETRWTFLLALDHVTAQIFTAESGRTSHYNPFRSIPVVLRLGTFVSYRG